MTTSKFLKSTTGVEEPPFSLIEHKGLVIRLIEELSRAASDFARNPRGFILDLFTDENKDLKRRRLIYAGLGLGLVTQLVFIGVIFIADWVKPKVASSEGELFLEAMVPPPTPLKKPDAPESNMPKGNSGEGGGGSGQNASRPATRGVLPEMRPTPPIVKPNVPEKHAPLLAVNPNILGPQDTPPPADSTLGVPTGDMNAAPSPGDGTGGGLGSGKGSGIGNGDGPGSGDGSGGNKGNKGQFGSPNGTGNGIMPFNQISKLPKEMGFSQFRWTYRPTPVVTPEAQENRVAGTVLLRATFHADGRITDIEVVNQVPFMTESAVASLMKSKFKPATINGQPITVTRVPVRIEVHYTGKD